MRITHTTFAMVFLLCLPWIASAQEIQGSKTLDPKTLVNVEREVKEFYNSYGEDLRWHRRDAIANRYDTNGFFQVGNGSKSLDSFESNKKYYQTKWIGPKSFEWKDISIEVVSTDTAVVVGRFEWETDGGETYKFSYTALVKKTAGVWRIRVEDESRQPQTATP
jgi:hypothetical protein